MEEHPQARQIVETLKNAGFTAYYAGGWVRDFLLNHPSDDIDIATDAPPETVQSLFSHTVPIGISFGIILVIIDHHSYEVATFRKDFDYQDGRRPSHIAFCSAQEDAKRRDFTINGMFFDPLKKIVIDYVEGKKDLEKKIIRAIGNPHERIQEDRLRMIRAIRLSCRLNFTIEEKTQQAIRAHAKELFPAVAIERVWQELTKAHQFGKLCATLVLLHEYHLLGTIFPELADVPTKEIEKRIQQALSYPFETPVIAFILALFPEADLPFGLELCKKFKLSRLDQDFVSSLFTLRKKMETSLDLASWAELYANRWIDLIIPIVSAPFDTKQQQLFFMHHEERKKKLAFFLQKIIENDPLIKASDLMQEGILPGKEMGRLLKEANRFCINEGIEDPISALQKFKTTPFWPCK